MPHDLTDTPVWASAVSVPDDGEDYDAITLEVPTQQLADRSAYLKKTLEDQSNGEFLYTAAGVPTVRTGRKWPVPIEIGRPVSLFGSGPKWTPADGWQMHDSADAIVCPILLPRGVVISGIEFGFHNQSSSISPVGVRIQRYTGVPAGPNTVGASLLVSNNLVAGDGSAGNLGLSAAINDTSRLFLQIEAGAGDGATLFGQCHWITLTVQDPGPRNT